MKSVLPNNSKTQNKLINLKEIHLVGCWARYGVMSYPFSGKYKKVKYDNVVRYVPLVWQYDDKNGTADNFYLRPIEFTTTGQILFWTFNKQIADNTAKALNLKENIKLQEIDMDLFIEPAYKQGYNDAISQIRQIIEVDKR